MYRLWRMLALWKPKCVWQVKPRFGIGRATLGCYKRAKPRAKLPPAGLVGKASAGQAIKSGALPDCSPLLYQPSFLPAGPPDFRSGLLVGFSRSRKRLRPIR